MSNILNKVKDAVTHDHSVTHDHPSDSTNAGPHDSNVANKMDPLVDSDRGGRFAHGNTAGTTGHPTGNAYGTTTGTTAGANTGMKTGYPATGNTYGTATGHPTTSNAPGSTNAGPHNTNMGNKMDPRVDSDRDGRNAFGSEDTTTKGFEQSQTQGATTSSTAHGLGSSNHGPHNSNMMNKMDPRVDSDRDHRAAPGRTTGHSRPAGTTGTTGTTGAAAGAGYHTHGMGTGTGTTTTALPHNSNIANEMDPRVDSDRSNYSTTTGLTGGTATGTATGTGTGHHYNTRSTNAGPHDTNMANKVDPRVDSDMDNRARHQHMGNTATAPAGSSYATQGTGQTHGTTGTTGTTGPHKSSLLNKLDPRVDSNVDRSFAAGNAQR